MKRLIRFLVVLGIATALLVASSFQVSEGSVAIVMRLGKPTHVASPGLHFKLPTPIDTVLPVDMRVHVLDPDSSEYLTRDKKNIVVDSFLAWKVADPQRFALSLGSPAAAERSLTDVLRSVLGDVLSSQEFSALVSAQPGSVTIKEVSEEITKRTRDRASERYGIEVKLALIKRLNFPGQNKDAVYTRMQADRKALAKGYRAEGEEAYEKITAKTDRQRAEMLAEAQRKADEIRGQADAEVLAIYNKAAEQDPQLWRFLREIELFEASFTEKSTVVLPADHELLNVFRTPSSASGSTAAGK